MNNASTTIEVLNSTNSKSSSTESPVNRYVQTYVPKTRNVKVIASEIRTQGTQTETRKKAKQLNRTQIMTHDEIEPGIPDGTSAPQQHHNENTSLSTEPLTSVLDEQISSVLDDIFKKHFPI